MKKLSINEMRQAIGLTWQELADNTGYKRRSLSDAQHKKHSDRLYKAVKDHYEANK